MGLLSQFTSVSVKTQTGSDVWAAPGAADLFPCASVKPNFESVLAENPEYTGTIDKPGDFLIGERVSVQISIPIRPAGGTEPPVADAYIPGRFLRAARFSEVILSAPIPAAPEAVAAGTESTATLGAGAAATADLYKGLALHLSDNGAAYNRQLTAIRSYSAAKVATLPEVLAAAPAANYQIPKQLAYQSGAAGDPPLLSTQIWYHKCRYDLINMAVSALKFTFPTSSRNTTDFPMMELTIEGDVHGWADEDAPLIGALGAIPIFKDGDFWVANKALGGSTFSTDMGIQVGYPPNPNKKSGNDAPQITQTKRTANLTLNHNLKATVDFRALATAQAQHALWAAYGYGPGSMVMFLIPDGRLTYPNPDNSGEFVTQTIDMLIDGSDRAVNLIFPY